MAGKRNVPQTVDQPKENSNMSTLFTPIDDADVLAQVLSGARGRGDYATILVAFRDAGIRLAQIPLDQGLLEGKSAQTVKTGFENAKASTKNPIEGADKLKVVKRSTGEGDKKVESVYLVNQAVESAE